MHISLPNANNSFSPLVLTVAGILILIVIAAFVVFIMRPGKIQRP